MFFSKKSSAKIEREAPTMPSAPPSLELDAVTVSAENAHGQTRNIIDHVSVSLTAPKTAIIGLNGMGKSTFLGLFNGITRPSQGVIKVCGVDISECPQITRQSIGMLFANPDAQLIMPTVLEDLELSLRRHSSLNRTQRLEQAHKLLAQQGLDDKADQSIFSLSSGEKQLVALTGILAVEPRILLLDEPTTLLDLRNRTRLINLLNSLDQMLIISTHDLGLAETCDEAVIIHNGELIYHGEAHEAVQQYRLYCEQGFPNENLLHNIRARQSRKDSTT